MTVIGSASCDHNNQVDRERMIKFAAVIHNSHRYDVDTVAESIRNALNKLASNENQKTQQEQDEVCSSSQG